MGALYLFIIAPPALFIGWLLLRERSCMKPGGAHHRWSQDPKQFRRRVCDDCGRAEVLMREWELDT